MKNLKTFLLICLIVFAFGIVFGEIYNLCIPETNVGMIMTSIGRIGVGFSVVGISIIYLSTYNRKP